MIEYEKQVTAYLGAAAMAAALTHAVAEFPKESCGFIANGAYMRCQNVAKDPLKDFEIDDPRYAAAVQQSVLTAVIHSHPNGPIYPTALDMEQQLATNVPWAIISLNETGVGKTVAWGDQIGAAPVVGRPFIHGIFDCYSLVRDTFRAGADELAKQGIGWPFPPIDLPQVPRDDAWWKTGKDLYADHLQPEGFKIISRSEARPGDGFLIKIGDSRGNPDQRLNHAGLLISHNLILHHLPGRNSRREPAGIWARAADIWVRYEGKPS